MSQNRLKPAAIFIWIFVVATLGFSPLSWAKKKSLAALKNLLAPVVISAPESKVIEVGNKPKTIELTFKTHSTVACKEITLKFRVRGTIELLNDPGELSLPCEKDKVESLTVKVRVKRKSDGKLFLDATVLTTENARHSMSRSIWVTAHSPENPSSAPAIKP